MRYVAVHDSHGSIAALIEGPEDGPPMVVRLDPGQEATEVDIAASPLDRSSFDTEEGAMRALADFYVDVKHDVRLVARDSRQSP